MVVGRVDLPDVDLDALEGPEPWSIIHRLDGLVETLERLDREMLPLERVDEERATWVNVLTGEGAAVPEHREGREPGDVTVVLFLTDADGGELVVDGEPVEPEPGRWVAFPSDTLHSVAPLNSGRRVTVAALYRDVS